MITELPPIVELFFFLLGFCIVWFKEYPPFDVIWKFFSWFLLVFFGVLFANHVKDRVKDWLK